LISHFLITDLIYGVGQDSRQETQLQL